MEGFSIIGAKGFRQDESALQGAMAVSYTHLNTATFVGYKNRGIPGAIAATLGVIAPSLVIIMIIAAFISNFIELSAVSSAFAGIRACVCVLIGSAVVKLAKKSLVDKGAIAIAAVVFVLSLFTSVSPADRKSVV